MTGAADKSFNQIRAAFMRRASAPNVSPFAMKLGYLIAYKYMNANTRTARPSQETLAADLNVSIRTVRRLTDILQPLGLVTVPGHGPGRASTYWIDPDKTTPVSPSGPQKRTPVSGIDDAEKRTPVSPIEEANADTRCTNTGHPVHEYRTRVSSQLRRRTKKGNQTPRAGARQGENSPDFLDADFEDFFRQWPPEKGGKEATRRLFEKIVRTGLATVEQLKAGAMRYGAACIGRELAKIATPLNWLKDGKWDEQYAAPSPVSSTNNNPREVAAVLARTIFAPRGRS
jgi:Helix-turn-helix domain